MKQYIIEMDWKNYNYLPYEKRLALKEVELLFKVKPKPTKNGVRLKVNKIDNDILDRLTYFGNIKSNGTKHFIPLQSRLEYSANLNGIPVEELNKQKKLPVIKRQSTRYSAHCLHEYKGKFHPQIVRSIGNLIQISKGATILDPFCGSGTSLLECYHNGWNALGLDLNPFAVYISNAKIQTMKIPIKTLESNVYNIIETLHKKCKVLDFEKKFTQSTLKRLKSNPRIDLPNRGYLEKWFSASVLAQLELIEGEIQALEDLRVQSIFRVILSDILRNVSFQDPGDLRIRRRKDPKDNYPAIPSFISNLEQKIQVIINARKALPRNKNFLRAILADSRQKIPDKVFKFLKNNKLFDGMITSPPYATALPYIDTQRLSLIFLGLLNYSDLSKAERSLIGNREITKSERDHEEALINNGNKFLPNEVKKLCIKAYELASGPANGFRRQNMPALLFRYFRDMQDTFRSLLPYMKPGGYFALVVGPNRTTLGGKKITIDTPRLLTIIAQSAGWKLREDIPLDAYKRFEMHRRNSIKKESLIILQKV